MASSDQQNNSFLLGLLGVVNQATNNQKSNTSPSSSSSSNSLATATTNTIPSFLSNTQVSRSDPIPDNITNSHAVTKGIESTIPTNNPSKDLIKHDSLPKASKPSGSTLRKTMTAPSQHQALVNNNGLEDNREFLANLLDNVASQSKVRSKPVIPSSSPPPPPPLEMNHGETTQTSAGDMDFDSLLAFHEGTNGKKKSKRKCGNKSKSGQYQQQRRLYNGSQFSNNNSSSNLDILTVANEVLGRDSKRQKLMQDIYKGQRAQSSPSSSIPTKTKPKKHPGRQPRDPQLPPLDKRVPCRYFKAGKCKEGAHCRFLHEGESVLMVCRHFKTGSCTKGNDCNFSHDLSLEPCRFFHLTGKCDTGPNCPYSHEPLNHDLRRRLHALTGPCKYYHLKGFCTNAEECLFSHETLGESELKELKASIRPDDDVTAIKPCTFFHIRGNCANGDHCTFSHAPITEEQRLELENFVSKNYNNNNSNNMNNNNNYNRNTNYNKNNNNSKQSYIKKE